MSNYSNSVIRSLETNYKKSSIEMNRNYVFDWKLHFKWLFELQIKYLV